MNNKLVSVIIPTFGGPKYLARCINSVLDQTYDNIEIIVVDDNGIGSEFQLETEETVKQYISSRVKYVCHEHNINGAAARNTGVRNSSGEYVAFLDDDDIFYPNKIERQVSLLDSLSNDYAFVYCSHEVYLGERLVRTVKANRSGYLFFEKISKQFEVQTSGILMRKSVFLEVNGFNESFRRHQDWEFVERVMFKYKIHGDDFMGYRRELYFRSDTTSPEKAKVWRMHYLDAMMPYINSLPQKQAQLVIRNNRADIILEFIKNKDLKGSLQEFKEAHVGLSGFFQIIKRIISSVCRGGKIR